MGDGGGGVGGGGRGGEVQIGGRDGHVRAAVAASTEHELANEEAIIAIMDGRR